MARVSSVIPVERHFSSGGVGAFYMGFKKKKKRFWVEFENAFDDAENGCFE